MSLEPEPFFKQYKAMERRDFLKVAGVGGAGLLFTRLCNILNVPIDQNPATPTLPPTPEPTPIPDGVLFLSENEVLEIPIAKTLSGELIPLRTFFEGNFQKNPDILGLFKNPSSVKFSAVGISTYDKVQKKSTIYPFFSAVSNEENKGFLAYVLQPRFDLVIAPPLNKIVDENGLVSLGITDHVYQKNGLSTPILIYSFGKLPIPILETRLTEEEIANMTPEELNKINLYFTQGGFETENEKFMGGKVQAIMAPLSEAPSLPELLGGDERYAQEILKQNYPWKYSPDKTQLLVDWDKSGNFEVAFEKVGDKWEIGDNKFVFTPDSAKNITGNETLPYSYSGKRIKKHFGLTAESDGFVDLIFTGKITKVPRYDLETGEILSGTLFIAEAFTQDANGTPVKLDVVVGLVINGEQPYKRADGIPDNESVIDSVFDYVKRFPSGSRQTTNFSVSDTGGNSDLYKYAKPFFDENRLFTRNGTPPTLLIPTTDFEHL
ncbi:MAG: twin-arginine translocation signal domain-containing protein [Patescibacteria group bacterium]